MRRSGAHSCNGELDVGNGFGEHCIGGHQVLNGGILLNGCICQIVKRRSHLLCLFMFGGLICTKFCVPGSHAIDFVHFAKGGGPMGLPVAPNVVKKQAMFPLAPGQHHVAARYGMLGTCGDHGFVGDGDSGIGCKDLEVFLFPCVDGKVEARVDTGMEVGHVVIKIRLADLGVGVEDVHEEGAEINGIKTFGGVAKNGIVDVIDRHRKLVACDGEVHLVGVPRLTGSGTGGA